MERAGVTVDRSSSPASIAFEAGFNAAVPFIDRHVPEGRGGKVAIHAAAGEVTYAELAANVNRCGNALLRLGLEKGQRLLLVVKDCPEFFYLFWGAIEAGVIPVPLNTILRAADHEGIIRLHRAPEGAHGPLHEPPRPLQVPARHSRPEGAPQDRHREDPRYRLR